MAEGATVVGPKPQRSPSLVGYPAADEEVRSLGNEVWGDANGRTVLEHVHGKGRVYWDRPLADVLTALGAPPDFEYSRPRVDTTLVSIHRRVGESEVYLVANQKDRAEEVEVRLRVAGKAAEIWSPESGDISPAGYAVEDGRALVPLTLGPHDAVFVVFREKAASPSRLLPGRCGPISRPSRVRGTCRFRRTRARRRWCAWTGSCPGRRTRTKGSSTSPAPRPTRRRFRPRTPGSARGRRLFLDLGKVKEVAEVSVNGHPVGLAWRPSFRVEVTGALKPGVNRLEVRITNLWANRMIGDAQPAAEKRYTFATFKPYKADSPLLESGLLGPVTLSSETRP